MTDKDHLSLVPPSTLTGGRAFLAPTFWYTDPACKRAELRLASAEEVRALERTWKEICEAAISPVRVTGPGH